MSSVPDPSPSKHNAKKQRPFRRAIFRGAGIVMPPLLTIVLFLWAWHIIESNVLVPIESGVRFFIVRAIIDEREGFPDDIHPASVIVETEDGTSAELGTFPEQDGKNSNQSRAGTTRRLFAYKYENVLYVPLDNRLDLHTKWIPESVHAAVTKTPVEDPPRTVKSYFDRYVDITLSQAAVHRCRSSCARS